MTTVDVFVYGSLMRGEDNHHVIAHRPFVGVATTAARYELIDLGPYPAMVEPGATPVHGELYRVDGDTLQALDRFEGCPDYYRRAEIELADGRQVVGYLFVDCERREGKPMIRSGNWRARR